MTPSSEVPVQELYLPHQVPSTPDEHVYATSMVGAQRRCTATMELASLTTVPTSFNSGDPKNTDDHVIPVLDQKADCTSVPSESATVADETLSSKVDSGSIDDVSTNDNASPAGSPVKSRTRMVQRLSTMQNGAFLRGILGGHTHSAWSFWCLSGRCWVPFFDPSKRFDQMIDAYLLFLNIAHIPLSRNCLSYFRCVQTPDRHYLVG